MEKLNIAEILKDCPKGMELDCTLFDDVYFDSIDEVCDIIKCYIKDSHHKIGVSFNKYGCYSNINKSKCVIFPKGKTTWEGFQRPFNDGDILTYMFYNKPTIYIYRKNGGYNASYYVAYSSTNEKFYFYHVPTGALAGNRNDLRFATEEEKQKLFDVIKANGYRWNAETKTLEKLIKPKFKVGDKIEKCTYSFTIVEVKEDYYLTKGGNKIPIENQDDFNLIPNKFDITSLKPFDKVLVRDNNKQKWTIDFFSFMDTDKGYPFVCVGHYVSQCVPYEGNEHLLGTTNDCNEYYKTWK